MYSRVSLARASDGDATASSKTRKVRLRMSRNTGQRATIF
jgi:hypothetical protein